jgi:hypothetical protein
VDLDSVAVLQAYQHLADRRVLVLESDGRTIRMGSPFSGVPTQHVVESGGVTYHANCAWDAFGIVAALQREAQVRSRCERSRTPLELELDGESSPYSEWLFRCPVPAAQWWDDIVFT